MWPVAASGVALIFNVVWIGFHGFELLNGYSNYGPSCSHFHLRAPLNVRRARSAVRDVSNSIQNFPHFGVLMRQLGYAITEGEMAYIRETEEFDQETLHILGNALDEAWRRVKSNHLNGRAYGARTVLAQHIFAMAKQGERDPHRLIDGALMRLTL
jgi:hypothetical protein